MGSPDRPTPRTRKRRGTYHRPVVDVGGLVSDGSVYVEAYRAAHGTDTATLQAAMQAATGKTLIAESGRTYTVTEPVVGGSGVTLDFGRAIIRADHRIRDGYFRFEGQAGIRVRGGVFDAVDQILPTFTLADYGTIYNAPLYFLHCHDVVVDDADFANLHTNAVFAFDTGTRFSVLHSRFTAGVHAQPHVGEHVLASVVSGKVMIDDCDFENQPPPSAAFGVCSVQLTNTYSQATIRGCRSAYGGRDSTGGHQLATYSFYSDHEHGLVDDCHSVATLSQAVRFSKIRNAEMRSCTVSAAPNAQPTNQFLTIESTYVDGHRVQGCQRVKVHHNHFLEAYDPTRQAINIGSSDYATPATDIDLHDNTIEGCAKALMIQGPCHGVRFKNNNIRGAHGGQVHYLIDYALPIGTAHGVAEAQSEITGITIDGNDWDTPASGAIPVVLDFAGANPWGLGPYTGAIGTHTIQHNTVRRAGAGTTQAVVVRGIAGKGVIKVLRNSFAGFLAGLDIANVHRVVTEDNEFDDVLSPTPVTFGGVGSYGARRNKFGTAPMSGTVTLAAGTATVFTAQAKADYNGSWVIRLTRGQVNGAVALGHLALHSTNSGASFTIRSVRGDGSTVETGDTSDVVWEIDH